MKDEGKFGTYEQAKKRNGGNVGIILGTHPVKNAADDNLIPRGGGAFLNEIDGNLTAACDESKVVEVHCFEDLNFPKCTSNCAP